MLLRIIASGFVLSLFCGADMTCETKYDETLVKNFIKAEQQVAMPQLCLVQHLKKVIERDKLSDLFERNKVAAFEGRQPVEALVQENGQRDVTPSAKEEVNNKSQKRAVRMLRTLGQLLTLPN